LAVVNALTLAMHRVGWGAASCLERFHGATIAASQTPKLRGVDRRPMLGVMSAAIARACLLREAKTINCFT
jgi:hypothetical protein